MCPGSTSVPATTITVIVPARDEAGRIAGCLQALAACRPAPLEVLVVDDASRDGTAALARAQGATVLELPRARGPAAARNLAGQQARGDVLLFTDADVRLHPDATARVLEALADPAIDAVVGSYDDEPGDPGFVSQYRNLLHHHVHQQGRAQASTFWTGCGAVRREVFLALGGFNEGYGQACIEDIEFGARLLAAGRQVRLEHALLARHDKRWTLGSVVTTDVLRRGAAWVALMLRERVLVSDLNVSPGQRLAALATGLLWLAAAVLVATGHAAALLPLGAWLLLAWALAPRSSPAPLGPGDRLAAGGALAAVLATAWLAGDGLAAAVLLPLAAVLALDQSFLRLLLRKRGARFAFAAAALRLLYFTCCLVSVPLGVVQHLRDAARARHTRQGPGVRRLAPLHGPVAADPP
jgi:GT2 family glycosyltransferase